MMRSWLMILALLVLPTGVAAETVDDAHARWNAALSTGDQEGIESLMAEDGWIVFSLEGNGSQLTLEEWFPHFRRALETGTKFQVTDLEARSGGADDAGWVFAVQELSWTPEGMPEPAVIRVWYTTEVWEKRDGEWMVVHIHHGSGPEEDGE